MVDRLTELRLAVDWLESALAVGYPKPKGWMGHKILTPFPDNSNGLHSIKAPIYGPEHLRLADTLHGLRAEPNEVGFSVTYQSEQLERHSLMAPMDKEEIRTGAAVGIEVPERLRRQVWYQTELAKEYAIGVLLQATATYDTGFSATTAAGDGWNLKTTPPQSDFDPVGMIRDNMETVRQANGQNPTFVAFGKTAWDAFIDNSYVTDRLRGGTGADAMNKDIPTVADVASWFALDENGSEIPQVYIGSGVYRNEVTQAMVDIWSDCCIVGINSLDPVSDPSPIFGVTLQEILGEVDGIPITGIMGDEWSNSWVYRVFYETWYKPWITKNDAAFLQLDVVK
jgi:hypothetical protein